MRLNYDSVRAVLFKAGFRGSSLNAAIQICFCESNFETTAHNTNGEDSRGLMQINIQANPKYKNLDLFDPETNAAVAFEMYNARGKTFKDWTCARLLGLTDPKKSETLLTMAGVAIIAGIVLYLT